ncbi:UNVERIFIED_CONTAM: Isoprene synthase, chloroplastic [Sesamum radiatum]|uniref:Isoprene synthase, chloroplastic n=1 Tax=Sesamum radiatum TaxID=300843 RepID=A0AAW2W8M1_SESRA
MEDEVRCMLENGDVEPLVLIELIDDIDRLGIAYRFQETIDRALERILLRSSQVEQKMRENLRSCALCFRLLRRHGYHVSTDIFESFKDSNGNFRTSLATEIERMLSLYEASHLALDGESTLVEAREFTSFRLKNMLGKMDMKSAMRVSRALELPSHHRMQRLEARWNIEMYDKQNKENQLSRKLAALDFNLVQKVHQRDLQEASRWDVNAVNDLPDYMKLFFFALYNTVNDMAYDTLKEQDQVIISQLKKVWADLCKAFLREAEWRYKKEIPKFDEYLDHGWTSSSGVVLLTHAYFLTSPNITHEAIKALNNGHGLLRTPSTVFRLANDLSSSKDDVGRGETAKAVSCYMHETGASDEVACAYIGKYLGRIALCQYQHGDAHTGPTDGSRNRVKLVIMEPIHIMK